MTDVDRAILELEQRGYRNAGVKERAVRALGRVYPLPWKIR